VARRRAILDRKNFLADLNERLEQVPFVAGEQFSAADITALVTIDFAKTLDISVPKGHRALTRWYAAVSARPSASA
jgi:glutathione S-transferase